MYNFLSINAFKKIIPLKGNGVKQRAKERENKPEHGRVHPSAPVGICRQMRTNYNYNRNCNRNLNNKNKYKINCICSPSGNCMFAAAAAAQRCFFDV